MEVNLFEVRDDGTYLPAICIRCTPANEAERYMLDRAGYGQTAKAQGAYVLFAAESDGQLRYDTSYWADNRTRLIAHAWIRDHWAELETGDVVDVRVILGETITPATPEREALAARRDYTSGESPLPGSESAGARNEPTERDAMPMT